jgi:molybdopterin-containing oxidoreductase family membrane subunit
MWLSLAFNITAFLLFLIPRTRNKLLTLNLGAFLIIVGVWIEKGPGFVAPGFIPDPLGEIYEYFPNFTELAISLGIWPADCLFLHSS